MTLPSLLVAVTALPTYPTLLTIADNRLNYGSGFLANLTTDRLLGCVLLCVSACCILGNFYVAFKSSKATQLKAIDAAAKGTFQSVMSVEGESVLSYC